MAAGDVKSNLNTVASGAKLTIQPPPGEEWVIHNIYYDGPVEVNQEKGALSLRFATDSSAGALLGGFFRATNTVFLTVKNVGNSSILIGYDGIQTK